MRLRIATMICALLLAGSGQAHAAITGNDLLEQCRSSNTDFRIHCLGYVSGVLDGIVVGAADKPFFCLPSSVTVGQVVDIMKKALESAPETRHQQARLLIVLEMSKRFPCSRQSS